MSAGPAVKPRDHEIAAAIAAFSGKVIRPVAKPVKAIAAGPIVMSRKAARPITMKLTQGFTFKSLSDNAKR